MNFTCATEIGIAHGLAQLGLVGDRGEYISLAFPKNKSWLPSEDGEGSLFVLPTLSAGRWRLVHFLSIDVFRQVLRGHGPTLPILADFTVLPNRHSSVESRPIVNRTK